MPAKTDWVAAMQRLVKKYKDTKHPLDYESVYQLLVMVVLSAQDSDRHINQLAPALFGAFPNMEALSRAEPEMLYPYIGKVRNFGNKAKWLVEIGRKVQKDGLIPRALEPLTALPGIGRKSANVILRESGAPPEGVIVDLHVLRVAPRLGIASGTDPKKIEKQVMEILPQHLWDAGMAMSFLGREICRPLPKCEICLMNDVCIYYLENLGPREVRMAGGAAKKASPPKEAAREKNGALKKETKAATSKKPAPAKAGVPKKTAPAKAAVVKKPVKASPAKKAPKAVAAKKAAKKK